MSKFLKAAVASSVLATSVMGANAAHAATAQADAKATILEQVTVASDGTDLDFATIVPAETGGGNTVVTVNAATGLRTGCVGSGICTGTTSAAGFDITGLVGQTVDISVDGTVDLSPDNVAAADMTATLNTSVATLLLVGGGADSFSVGGELTVPEDQPADTYTGTFDVTVTYQ